MSTPRNGFIRIYSGLTEVPTDIPSGAKRVSLNDNRITVIHKNAFGELSECTELILYDNRLDKIESGAFSGLLNLQILDINNNDMKELRPDMWVGLSPLIDLRLGLNELEDLELVRGDMFEGLPALKRLFSLSNGITSLDPGAFINLPHLEWLFLGRNDLKALDMRTFLDPSHPDEHPRNLYVDVEWNNMECDERLCWLKEAETKNWIKLDFITVTPGKCANYPQDAYWIDIKLNCA